MLRWASKVDALPGGSAWSDAKLKEAIRESLTAWQSIQLGSRGSTVSDSARFHDAMWGLQVKWVAGGPTVELKRMPAPTAVPTIDDLYLPPLVGKLAAENRGFVLITGIGRSGRSRTMAAMVDRINRTRSNHIVTLEEPILYLHKRQQSVVEQRQVALDVPSFSVAMDEALQESPQVLAVGDLSDSQTVASALAAAEHSLIVGRVTSSEPWSINFAKSTRLRGADDVIQSIKKNVDRLTGTAKTARELYDKMLELYPERVNPPPLWLSVRTAKP